MFFSKILGVSVPFVTYKLKSSRVILYNSSELEEEIHDECSYLVSSDKTYQYLDHEKGRLFYAERYGGSGMLSHGGGSRCGVIDRFQVKGIGLNPVAGVEINADYSTGHLKLINGVCEYFNARLINSALPLGCVEHLAVIELPFEASGSCPDTSVKTGLLIREPAIRPAHFERAIFFKPLLKEFYDRFNNDTERVKQSLSMLVNELKMPDRNLQGSIEDFLKSFLTNCAHQMAVAYVKRIQHGGISSSNIDINARWLDLETVMFLGWGAASADNLKEFKLEHRRILETIDNLTFYIEKYVFRNSKPHNTKIEQFATFFLNEFDASISSSYLVRAGFPEFLLSKTNCSSEMATLATELHKLNLHALKALESLHTSAKKSDPFLEIVTSLIFKDEDASYMKLLKKHNIAVEDGLILKAKFDDFRFKFSIEVQQHSCTSKALDRWLMININRSTIGLDFKNAHDYIVEWSLPLCEHPSTEYADQLLKDLYSTWCDACDNSFADSRSQRTLCWAVGGSRLEYDIIADIYIFSTPGKALEIFSPPASKCNDLTKFLEKIPFPLVTVIRNN